MSRRATARLFAAVDPPPEVAAELTRWARSAVRAGGDGDAPPLRVLDAGTLHLTLLFLGERPNGEADALADALSEAAAAAQPCELATGAPVWLPSRRPRALAVEIHDAEGELAELQRDLARGLCAITGEQPPRRFRAHVTVARSRSAPRSAGALPRTPQLGFRVSEVVLYRSHLDPSGARYEPLASAPLGCQG